jgi:hypothetical protein
MPRAAQMSLVPKELKQVVLYTNLNIPSDHAPQAERKYQFCMQNNQGNFKEDQLSMKSPVELKG